MTIPLEAPALPFEEPEGDTVVIEFTRIEKKPITIRGDKLNTKNVEKLAKQRIREIMSRADQPKSETEKLVQEYLENGYVILTFPFGAREEHEIRRAILKEEGVLEDEDVI